MQEAIIVMLDRYNNSDSVTNDILNKKLKEGWKVVNMCSMPSSNRATSTYTIYPTCLVIIER